MPRCKRCKDTRFVADARQSAPCPECTVPVDPLPDEKPMPFGQHEGTPMSQVPASYLLNLRGHRLLRRMYPTVADYIESNRETLEWEASRE